MCIIYNTSYIRCTCTYVSIYLIISNPGCTILTHFVTSTVILTGKCVAFGKFSLVFLSFFLGQISHLPCPSDFLFLCPTISILGCGFSELMPLSILRISKESFILLVILDVAILFKRCSGTSSYPSNS